ncbi:MAG: Mut7-C RNAse domain-containing protein [Thermoplasmata archaeon]|nr:Mut7-C RNAse domain-containing protein [Thermoplasmata archaeon]
MAGATERASVRFLADEMLGRLARYLRFVGFDTAYARGMPDDEILRWSAGESRVLLTRDRRLAGRSPSTLLLTSGDIIEQFRRVRAAYPDLPFGLTFDRCTLCNGTLVPVDISRDSVATEAVPEAVRASGVGLFRCTACGHVYWEGSHTRAIRERLASWST